MKTISLLTMVFLPATAIAVSFSSTLCHAYVLTGQTIIGPFVKLDADDRHLVMAPQFYLFWAVSAPVTILVVLMWVVWLQRTEIANYLEQRRKLADRKARESKESCRHMA